MKIAVTGSTGFIGRALCKQLTQAGFSVIALARKRPIILPECRQFVLMSAEHIDGFNLNSVDLVIHLAALAHDAAANATEEELADINVKLTSDLARSAANNDARRFIFLSSIGVNGNRTLNAGFASDSAPMPHNHYSESKYQAEEALKKVCAATAMDYVIIRPPLVYGPGVKANFLSMLKWASRGVPLPLGGIKDNKRSLVFVDNLVDLIKVCIEHPAAANQTFLVSDDDDVSTRELLVRVATALGVQSRLLNIPPSWLGLVGKLLGKKDIEQRLCASLQVDIAHTKNTLNWRPPYSMEEGLKQTADWYKARS
jgi:nucleoside-diphosphate-sugar epimerase